MNPVDKRRVRRSFSRSARAYDGRAAVQREIQDRMLALLGEAAPEARRALDVGAGTGALLARLAAARPRLAPAAVDLAPGMAAAARARVPSATVAAADAEALPFRSGAFDLVVSTSTFQWLPRLEPAFAEARRVLAPGGVLAIALFGARTLRELRDAWAAAGAGAARTHRFFSRDDVERALAAAGLATRSVVEEDLVEHHPDARAVLRSLKAIGATNAVPGARGLGGRGATLEMLRRYEDGHAGPRGVPATWHVVWAVAAR
ncbi:methyltransferase domain-containing protein [Anaeromyxobacter oryzae]|uniref:Malonyl-[acyl-carrier protein] O-methyltransferase n=1 Tax=Anaeromyxobacter oryzae TaxID=2918170 RepID=A0ABN6MSB3_9BACT|nr:methyltransferase domain-containing protein [Anaeromyxobacter oryzae]BDG02643.1 malonyl-[acyl-carrier protein] O-methyltransferase [Anaeromyxobacter oryzae]